MKQRNCTMKSDVNKAPRGEDDNQYDLFGGPEGATYRPGGNAYAAARAGELVDAANEQQNGSASHGAGDNLVATSATPPAPTQSKPERKKGDIPCGLAPARKLAMNPHHTRSKVRLQARQLVYKHGKSPNMAALTRAYLL